MDVPTFQAQYQEFRETSATVITAMMARATRLVSANVWGTFADDGIALLTADFLVSSPSGTTTASAPNGKSIYRVQFEELQRSVVGAFSTAGCWGGGGRYGGGGCIP